MGVCLKPFDASGAFRPAARESEIGRLAVRNAGVTISSQGLVFVLQMVATMVLARLLTATDFGLVAMVSTFSLLLMSFGLNGFTEAIIQWEEIDRFTVSNIFWIALGGGVLLAVGFAASGSLLAWFYRDARVASVAIGMAPTIALSSLAYPHLALLKRGMRFTAVSVNDVVARTVSVILSVVLAWAGWGYWALVAGAVVLAVCTTVGAWVLCRWMPSLPRRTAGTKPMIRFALNVYGRYGLRYGSRNADKALIGWRFSAGTLGFYKKAYDLFNLASSQLIAPVEHVALSTLSRLNRNPALFRRYVLNALAMIAFVGMGVGADLALTGKDVIRLVLGGGWEEAGRIFVFFGPGIGIMLLHAPLGWIHLSIGRPDRWLRWTAVEFAATTLMFVITLPWGAGAVAAAWTASFCVLLIPGFWYAGRPINLTVSSVLAVIWKHAAAAVLGTAIAAAIIHARISFAEPPTAYTALARIAAISALFAPLYLGAVILLHRGLDPIYDLAGLVREMAPWARRPVIDARAAEVSAACRVEALSLAPTDGSE